MIKNILILNTGKEWGGGINSLLASYLFEILIYNQPRGSMPKIQKYIHTRNVKIKNLKTYKKIKKSNRLAKSRIRNKDK